MKIKCACGNEECDRVVFVENGYLLVEKGKTYTSLELNQENTQQLIKALQEELGRMVHGQ